MRKPTASGALATVAIALSMSGGAYAAGRYVITSTSQIKPSVLKKLEAKPVAGPAGPQGPAGTPGTNGINGTNGSNASAVGPQGPQGATGPAGTPAATPTVVTNSVQYFVGNNDYTQTAIATCPSGDVVTGGGGDVVYNNGLGGQSGAGTLGASEPYSFDSTTPGWIVTGTVPNENSTYYLYVYAICEATT